MSEIMVSVDKGSTLFVALIHIVEYVTLLTFLSSR